MVGSKARHAPLMVFGKLPTAAHDEWDRLAAASNQGTVYHSVSWLQAISQLTGEEVTLWGVYHEGRLIAGVPLQIRQRGPLRFAHRAFATPYGNTMLQSDLEAALYPSLVQALKHLALSFSRVTLTASPFAEPLEEHLAWRPISRATYLLRSSSLGGLWSSMASEVRNRIRKAEKAGISVTMEFLPASFYETYSGVFQRQGSEVSFSKDSFDQFLTTLQAKGVGKVYTARNADRTLCAACLIVYDDKRAYYSLAASHPELKKTGAPSLLVWEVLREVLPGVDEFDFGGANVPHVAQFKSKFRGRLLRYPEYSHDRSIWEKVLIDCMRRARSLVAAGTHG